MRFMMLAPFNGIPGNDNSFQMKYSHMTLKGKNTFLEMYYGTPSLGEHHRLPTQIHTVTSPLGGLG